MAGYTFKALSDAGPNSPHIFGFGVARLAGDTLFEVWNGAVSAAKVFHIDYAGGIRASGNVTYTSADAKVVPATTDGADTSRISICGGGDYGDGRGGFVTLYGNEYPASGGSIVLTAGNVVLGTITAVTGGAIRSVINNAGNIGYNTTDIEAWPAPRQAFQLGATAAIMFSTAASAGLVLMDNAYYDGAWKYRVADNATIIGISPSSGIFFQIAAAGLIDAPITWTTAFQIAFDATAVFASTVKATGFLVGANQVVGARNTGWAAFTGSTDKATTYNTGTVTLPQLAGRVAMLQAMLTTHGLIG